MAAFASVCALVWDPSAPAAAPKRALALLLALAGLAAVMVSGGGARVPSRAPRAGLFAVAFVVVSGVSVAWGVPGGLLDLGSWGAALAVAWLAFGLGRARAIRAARGAALLTGGLASAACAVARHGGQGNPNWLGLALAVTFPLSLDAAVSAWREVRAAGTPGRRLSFGLAAAATAVQPAAMIAAHARVALVATGVALLVLAWKSRRARVALGGLGAASAGLGLWLSDVTTASASLGGRVAIWAHTARIAGARPFGVGLGRFSHAYLDRQGEALAALTPHDAARAFVHAGTAHDDVLQVAAESGWIAALLLAAAVALGIRAQIRGRWPAGAAALAALGVTMLGDSPLRQPAPVLLAALVFGALPASLAPDARTTAGGVRVRAAALALVCAGLLVVSGRVWLAADLRTSAGALLPPAKGARLAKGAAADPFTGAADLDLGLERLAREDFDGAAAALSRAHARLADPGTPAALGEAHLGQGDAAAAIADYRAALAWSPGSVRARVGLAEALRRAGRLDEAEEHATIARALSPASPRPRALLDAIGEDRIEAATEGAP